MNCSPFSFFAAYFQDNGGIARFSAILMAGFHPDSLAVLEKDGKVEKVSRGLYRLTDHVPVPGRPSLAEGVTLHFVIPRLDRGIQEA